MRGKRGGGRAELTLLTTAELLDLLLLVHDLGVERHTDPDAGVALHPRHGFRVRLVGGPVLAPVRLALDDEAPVARRHQLLKDGCELLRDLLERPLNRLVLLLVEMLDQGLDRLLRRVQLLAPLEKLLTLCGEAVVLIKRLLVDVLVLLERLVDFPESRFDLLLSVTR